MQELQPLRKRNDRWEPVSTVGDGIFPENKKQEFATSDQCQLFIDSYLSSVMKNDPVMLLHLRGWTFKGMDGDKRQTWVHSVLGPQHYLTEEALQVGFVWTPHAIGILLDSNIEAVYRAITHLHSVTDPEAVDGVGFNKHDARFGEWMAKAIASTGQLENQETRSKARHIAHKYALQLAHVANARKQFRRDAERTAARLGRKLSI